MFCGKCGAKNADNAEICTECGARLRSKIKWRRDSKK